MNGPRALIVHNSAAGDGSIEPEVLRAIVDAAGYESVYSAIEDDHWRNAISEADLAVAVGGDGTVQQVFVAAAGTTVPVAVVPGGTANNIARALRIPVDDPVGLVAAMMWSPARTSFDVPLLSINGREERFVEAVGAGVFAELLASHEAPFEGNDGGLRRLRGLLDEAEEQPWHVEADAVDLTGDYIAVEAMNVNESGPNILLAPDADTSDGLIDLVLLEEGDRTALQHFIARYPTGDTSLMMQFRTVRCREVILRVPENARLRRDDHVEVTAAPGFASIRTDGTTVNVVLPHRR